MILLTIALSVAGLLFLGAIVYLLRSTANVPKCYRDLRQEIPTPSPSQWDEVFNKR